MRGTMGLNQLHKCGNPILPVTRGIAPLQGRCDQLVLADLIAAGTAVWKQVFATALQTLLTFFAPIQPARTLWLSHKNSPPTI